MSLPPGATLISGDLPEVMKLPPGASLVSANASPAYVPPAGPAHAAARRNFAASQGTITPEERAANPVNQAVLSTLKGAETTAGAIAAPELLPELGAGAAARYLIKPIVSGAGAGIASLASGQSPTAAAIEAGSTALGGTIFEGLGDVAKGVLKTGIFGDGLANYFAKGPNGAFVPTDEAKQIQKIHEAIGVKPGNMNIGLGATSADDAYNLPGRSILNAGLKPQDLEGLNPFQQAEKLKPIWQQAGKDVSAAAQKATDAGVKFDGAKSLTQAIGDMLDPEGSKALAMVNDTAKQLGIKNWAKMTPNQALELKQTLWDRLPGRFRGPVYGALTRDMNKAVPEMVPANRTYGELREAMEAIKDNSEKYMSRAGPSKMDQLLAAIKQHPMISGATGLSTVTSLYGGYRSLKDLLGKP